MSAALAAALTLFVLPVLVVGVIQRVKALVAGRRGPPLLQVVYDLVRLLRKQPVYSEVSTPVFRLAPHVVLATTLVSGLVATGAIAFAYDFVFFAYVWGLGRVALMLGALDTGSAFEGMGASREATYGALVEPVLFLVLGTLCLVTEETSLAGLLTLRPAGDASAVVFAGAAIALLVVVQVETARMPVDDPATHLELTMIHEVMILDHSARELAALQLAAAMKLTIGLYVLAALLDPWPGVPLAHAGATLVLAVVVGAVESFTARLKLNAIPQYILFSLVAASVALLATSWRGAGG